VAMMAASTSAVLANTNAPNANRSVRAAEEAAAAATARSVARPVRSRSAAVGLAGNTYTTCLARKAPTRFAQYGVVGCVRV
jgi:hypothetical protein